MENEVTHEREKTRSWFGLVQFRARLLLPTGRQFCLLNKKTDRWQVTRFKGTTGDGKYSTIVETKSAGIKKALTTWLAG